jgi:hypothetical protein
MVEKKKALLLRIAPDLWEALNRWAKHELRSVNAQIEYVLREAVRQHTGQRLPPSTPSSPPDPQPPPQE